MKNDKNILTIKHQDGLKKFKLSKGGYSLDKHGISISIETNNIDKDGFPDCALLCLANFPVKNSKIKVGDVYEHDGGMNIDDFDDEYSTMTHGYFTFHVENVYLYIKVIKVINDEIEILLKARHDDVNYYDKRAKECPTSGNFRIKRKPRSRLWIPD